MRTPTSFAALVTLMAVASSAAPIGAAPDSARALARTFAPPDTKTPESFNKCHECRDGETTISVGSVKPLKDDLKSHVEGDKNSKVLLDVGKTQLVGTNGKSLVDGLRVDADLELGDKGKSQLPAHPGNGWPDKTHGPDVDVDVDLHANDNDKHQGGNGHQGGGKPQGKDDCLDPKNAGLDVCVAIRTGMEGGKKDIDVIHKETKGAVDSTTHHADDLGKKAGDALKAEASVALGEAHGTSDKTMNRVHEAGNDIHAVAVAGLGSNLDKVGGTYKPALAAVHAEVGSAYKIAKDHDYPVMVAHGPKDQKSAEDCDDVSITALNEKPKVATSIIRRILSASWFA